MLDSILQREKGWIQIGKSHGLTSFSKPVVMTMTMTGMMTTTMMIAGARVTMEGVMNLKIATMQVSVIFV